MDCKSVKDYVFLTKLGNTFDEIKFRKMISNAIKEREQFILNKNSMMISTDSKIVEALASSSMLSSNLYQIKI